MAAELYTSDGFAKQIDTYKDLALSASNAIRYKSWDDNISVASSVGTVVNTVKWGGASAILGFYSTSDKPVKWVSQQITDFDSSYARVKITDLRSHFGLDSSYFLRYFGIRLYSVNLPVAGTYDFSFDSSSQFTYSVDDIYLDSIKKTSNAADQSGILSPPYSFSGGDFYISPYKLGLTNVYFLTVFQRLSDKTLNNLDVVFHARFVPSIGTPSGSTVGTDTSSQDTQNTIANATSQIASSVNDVYDSIHDLMQHISNQLAALWDQIYNYCHVPTYNKLQEILLSIQNISMGSDLQKIADQISNSTTEQTNDLIENEDARTDDIINNQNSNQQKTEAAIEKHGNFIIEGLKSLFIPSDEFFKSWFDDMYNFFHDRLGFLMLPIDILIKFIKMFQSAGSNFSGIPFPEFKWLDGTVIIPAQSVQFEFLSTSWGKDIQTKLYFVGNVIMIGALLALMHRKLEEVLGN